MGFSKPTFIGPYDHIYNLEKKKKKHFAAVYCKLYLFLVFSFFFACGTQRTNFDEKVYKPQSKSYGRIGVNTDYGHPMKP